MPADSVIPDLPGDLVPPNSDQERWLKQKVATLCQLEHQRFPGSQPISFAVSALDRLQREDFWVCEKSDGIRILFFICTGGRSDQTVYLIDRHNTYRCIKGFFFPHHMDPQLPLRSTLIDGELVLDVDARGVQTLRLLCFDCLAIDDENVMSRSLDKRYGRLQNFFYNPYRKMLQDHPQMRQGQPFDIKVKPMERAYAIDKIFAVDVPNLQHGHDGLIFTCVNVPYAAGTDNNILKWKPPSENSIDFKLVLRFPAGPRGGEPDFHAKPIFALHVWNGGEGARARYEPFDVLSVDDDEWEEWKASGEQIDDRVVEVTWDMERERWRKLRFRDDKPNGNHRTVVDKIILSIADGVEQATLIERGPSIKNAWKAREGQPQATAQAQPTRVPNGHAARRPDGPPVPPPNHHTGLPPFERRYGPPTAPRWSRASGPATIAGIYR